MSPVSSSKNGALALPDASPPLIVSPLPAAAKASQAKPGHTLTSHPKVYQDRANRLEIERLLAELKETQKVRFFLSLFRPFPHK